MRRIRILLAAAVLAAVVGGFVVQRILNPAGPVPAGMPTPAPPAGSDGWIDLLDAEHAPKWKNITDGKEIFEITSAGELHIFGRTIYPLRYVGYAGGRFGNFDLHIEFKLAGGANSGLFLRAQEQDPVYRGFEVQVLEDFGEPPSKNSCGSLYDIATPMYNLSRPAGEWNSYDLSIDGSVLEVTMNGWLILRTDLSLMKTPLGKFPVPFAELPAEGVIALQDHGGEAWFRNIRLRPR